jgi:hypothetical protein
MNGKRIKERKKERKKDKERRKQCLYEERKNKIKLPGSLDALEVSRGFKIKTHTHLSNHVQSDNEDFVCASGSLLAICTCPLISKSVCLSLSPPCNIIFPMTFLTSLNKTMRSLSCFNNISIIIS